MTRRTGLGDREQRQVIALAGLVALGALAWSDVSSVRDVGPPQGPSGSAKPAARSMDFLEPGAGHLRRLAEAGPTRSRCRGVTIQPEQNGRRVMRRHPPGTTYCIAEGVHRLTRPLVPQDGDSLVGVRGAVLNGSKVLSGWQAVPEGWSTSAFLPREPSRAGECLTEQPLCTFAEDVFIDGQPLTRAASLDDVTAGIFYADYTTNVITIGTEPGGRLVEQAVSPSLVRSAASGVTVRNLVVEKSAGEAQLAAIDGRTSSPRTGARWTVKHNLVQLNHGVGIGVGSRGVVRSNVVQKQGQLGISVWEERARVQRNQVLQNGTMGYDPDWEAGGLKAWMTTDVKLLGNLVHDNRGPALWSDGACLRTTYRGNHIADNWGAGIQHEISYDALIERNNIAGNGRRHKGWAWEAGIQIQSSGGLGRGLIVVRGNTVADNAHGIMVLESGQRLSEWPATHGPHVVRNVLVRSNTVTLRPGQWTGVVQDVSSHEVFEREIRFRDNTYHLDSATQESFAWKDDELTWKQWRSGARQDRGGRLALPLVTPRRGARSTHAHD